MNSFLDKRYRTRIEGKEAERKHRSKLYTILRLGTSTAFHAEVSLNHGLVAAVNCH